MSERPFMQLYVSDFIGDTLSLSTEQIGAYMLLLMAMWNAGGRLPADDAKLARIVRLSVKKWRAIAADLMTFFDGDDDAIWHNRLTRELHKSESKSQSRASAGAIGGRAKSLKNKDVGLANASDLPKHLPDTIKNPSSLRSDGGARKRASRLPEDWQLPDEWQQDAIDAGLSVARIAVEAAKMRDWSRSAPTGAKLDWRAAWRNWCRKSASDAPLPRGSPRQSVPDLAELFAMAGERVSDERPAENFTGSRQALPNLSLVRSGRNGG